MSIIQVSELTDHKDKVWSVSWNSAGTLLASCSSDRDIRIWGKSGNSWESSAVLTGAHRKTIRSVAWSPDGSFLASASFDGTTCLWDHRGGEFECVTTIELHKNEVKSVGWSSSGRFIATCGRDKSVYVWKVEEDNEYSCASVLTGHTDADVKRVRWHPLEDILASASYDDTINFYKPDGDDWTVYDTLRSHTSTVWAIDFNNKGDMMASCSDDKTIKIWRRYFPGYQFLPTSGKDPKWKCVSTISGYHDRAIYDISWCPSTDMIATACGDNGIRVFKEAADSDPHLPTFNLIVADTDTLYRDVNSVHWNPKIPGLLASGGDDGIVRIWEVKE